MSESSNGGLVTDSLLRGNQANSSLCSQELSLTVSQIRIIMTIISGHTIVYLATRIVTFNHP